MYLVGRYLPAWYTTYGSLLFTLSTLLKTCTSPSPPQSKQPLSSNRPCVRACVCVWGGGCYTAVWTSPLDQGGAGDRERSRMSASSPSDDSKEQEWPSDGRENLPFVVSERAAQTKVTAAGRKEKKGKWSRLACLL